jgi:PAS domain S-box-containing protein
VDAKRSADWLSATVGAVRELMIKRLEAESPNADGRRDMEMALEELDVMWEELQGQAALLIRENQRYAEFFDYAPDAYVITDAGANVREANHAALELLGAPADEVVGKPFGDWVAAEDRVHFLARTVGLMLGAADRPAPWDARLRVRGAPLACEFSVRAIPLKKSGVGGLCWLIRPAG